MHDEVPKRGTNKDSAVDMKITNDAAREFAKKMNRTVLKIG
jgi:hypothetical protein